MLIFSPGAEVNWEAPFNFCKLILLVTTLSFWLHTELSVLDKHHSQWELLALTKKCTLRNSRSFWANIVRVSFYSQNLLF